MAMGEFDLIKRYFQQQILVDDSVPIIYWRRLCAGFRARELSACHYDRYNGGKYAFLPTISPEDLAYKAVCNKFK